MTKPLTEKRLRDALAASGGNVWKAAMLLDIFSSSYVRSVIEEEYPRLLKLVSPPVEHEPGTHEAFLRLIPWGDYFFAQAAGRCMEPALRDGALLQIERTKDVREGEIVAFRIGSGLALKRLAYEGGRMALRPDNPGFEPIYPDEEEDFEIFGVVRRWASWGEAAPKKKASGA